MANARVYDACLPLCPFVVAPDVKAKSKYCSGLALPFGAFRRAIQKVLDARRCPSSAQEAGAEVCSAELVKVQAGRKAIFGFGDFRLRSLAGLRRATG